MSSIAKKMADAIDIRKMRDFDKEAFQSYNAQEIEAAAVRCEHIAAGHLCSFLIWATKSGYVIDTDMPEDANNTFWVKKEAGKRDFPCGDTLDLYRKYLKYIEIEERN